jgi:hypothetical protein
LKLDHATSGVATRHSVAKYGLYKDLWVNTVASEYAAGGGSHKAPILA